MIVLRYESLDNPCFQKTRGGGGGGGVCWMGELSLICHSLNSRNGKIFCWH